MPQQVRPRYSPVPPGTRRFRGGNHLVAQAQQERWAAGTHGGRHGGRHDRQDGHGGGYSGSHDSNYSACYSGWVAMLPTVDFVWSATASKYQRSRYFRRTPNKQSVHTVISVSGLSKFAGILLYYASWLSVCKSSHAFTRFPHSSSRVVCITRNRPRNGRNASRWQVSTM